MLRFTSRERKIWSNIKNSQNIMTMILNLMKFFEEVIYAIKPAIMIITFRVFLLFDKILLSREVKRSVIIINKHGIFELPHKLPNDLRLRVLET